MSHLPREVVDGIEKVLVFMGYPHSTWSHYPGGHAGCTSQHCTDWSLSYLLSHWKDIKTRLNGDKYELCSEMVHKNFKVSPKFVNRGLEKGYSFHIPTQWLGNFSQLKIIGDKSAGIKYAQYYSEEWSAEAEQTFNDIEQVESPAGKLSKVIQLFRNLSRGVLAIQRDWDSKFRMLETHLADFIYNPKKILRKICDFLNVDCREDYLEACDSDPLQEQILVGLASGDS